MHNKLILILSALIFAGCDLFKNDERLPMFIDIDDVKLSTTDGQGGNTHDISYVWASNNGQSRGTYELPASIALLSEEELIPMVYSAGVKRNGFLNSIVRYPFYEPIRDTILFEEGAHISPELVFNYRQGLRFVFVEDFESSNIFTEDVDDDPDTFVERSGETASSGEWAAKISLDTLHPSIEFATIFRYPEIPTNNTPVYLELNYKNDTELGVGLLGHLNGQAFPELYITLFKSQEWNKIYIDFSPLLLESQLEEYSVYFKASLPEEQSTGTIFLDNIKLIHF